MSLRLKFILYIVFIHIIFSVVTVFLLGGRTLYLFAVEGFFFVSLVAGLLLVHRLFAPIRLIRNGIELIRSNEFGIRFLEVGQPDLDPLIRVYNRMADHLREQRTHSEEQEHFLGQIIRGSPSGVLTLDLDGRIAMANASASRMLGLHHESLIGRELGGLGNSFADRLAVLNTGESGIILLHGSRRVRCRALSFMDRGFARRFLLMDELTEELHRSERAAYEKLIRVMSHEVNNTAGAVSSLLESCLSYGDQIGEKDREDYIHALSVAISRTGRMNLFMQDYAEVVRLPKPRKEPVDLRRLLDEVILLMTRQCGEKSIEWSLDTENTVPDVLLDPGQMEQVFINILRNSIEAIDTTGSIHVHIGTKKEHPVVSIKDNGGGISPEIESHMFTPFFSGKKGGQGIGLTMVREILLGHGFDFTLAGLDKDGVEFTIIFCAGDSNNA